MPKFLTRKKDGRKFPVSSSEKEYRKEYHAYTPENQDYNVVNPYSGKTVAGQKSSLQEAKTIAKKKATNRTFLRITKDVGYVEKTKKKPRKQTSKKKKSKKGKR